MQTWYACYIVLNSSEYLWYSIKSVYDFIKETDGKIIIIEGSTKYASSAAKDGNSLDDTKDIIEDFIKDSDPGFIIHKRLGKVDNKAVLRNAYLDVIRKLPQSEYLEPWVLVVDDDELYKKEDLRSLGVFLEGHQDIVYIYNPQYWFWKDKSHVCVIDEYITKAQIKVGKRKDKLFVDITGREMRQGEFHERIFKYTNDLKYKSHSVVTDGKDRDIYIDPFYEKNRIVYPGCPRYHYGYLKKKQRLIEKFMYYSERDNKISHKNQEMLMNHVNVNPYMLYLEGSKLTISGNPNDRPETGFNKLNRLYPEYIVIEFREKHPEIAKSLLSYL